MLPRDLEEYLSDAADKLGELGAEFVESADIALDRHRIIGVLDASLRFPGGESFHVSLAVRGPAGHPEWISYSFHLMDDRHRLVFRYDNMGFHPGRHFPHHKHVGHDETVVDVPRPSLAQVIAEVRERVYGPASVDPQIRPPL